MRGLKRPEDEKFNKYFEMLQKEAEKQGKVFFVLIAEGRDLITEEFEGEDLTGWLVPIGMADEFEKEWINSESSCAALKQLKRWADYFCWAEWKYDNNKLEIIFEFFEDIDEDWS